ncbi:MAG: hypothetical protein ACD_12C00855G0003 [uncultured bacterium]|nr:MAG: hypothetical protein ACD_12C00855G0003 [uncultured bacterium]
MPEEINKYIKYSLEKGLTKNQIAEELIKAGWAEQLVNQAFQKIDPENKLTAVSPKPTSPPKKSEWDINIKNISAAQILLFLGAIVMVIAAVIYIGIGWSSWGSAARITAILIPLVICLGIGIFQWNSGKYKKIAIVFLLTGSLLFPFFLSVTFKELEFFAKPYNDSFKLTVSLLTLALFLLFSRLYKFPIWSFLYLATGIFTYNFFFNALGINSFNRDTTLAWLFLVFGTAYFLLSLIYEKNGDEKAKLYSHILGAVIIIYSLFNIFVDTFIPSREYVALLLLLLGAFYIILGTLFETMKKIFYVAVPYFIGFGLIFLSFFRLGVDGTLLKEFFSSTGKEATQNIIGWSNLIVGFIYFFLAWLIKSLKNRNLNQAADYQRFFRLVGPFWILGSIFYLGLEGHKYIYETLLLLSSLGFVFGSLPKKSRQYLYLGTLFLIIYIFSIGSEYFQNKIGWPITLFVAGLISMIVGASIEMVRKKYFGKGGLQKPVVEKKNNLL